MEFFLYWKDRVWMERQKGVLKALGLVWNKKDLFRADVKPDSETEEIMLPLSTLLVPDLMKQLRTNLVGINDPKNQVVEMAKWKREDFLSWYRNRTSLKT
jgi:hypothetical protein